MDLRRKVPLASDDRGDATAAISINAPHALRSSEGAIVDPIDRLATTNPATKRPARLLGLGGVQIRSATPPSSLPLPLPPHVACPPLPRGSPQSEAITGGGGVAVLGGFAHDRDRKPRDHHMLTGGRQAVVRKRRLDKIVFGLLCFVAGLLVFHVVGRMGAGGGDSSVAPISRSSTSIVDKPADPAVAAKKDETIRPRREVHVADLVADDLNALIAAEATNSEGREVEKKERPLEVSAKASGVHGGQEGTKASIDAPFPSTSSNSMEKQQTDKDMDMLSTPQLDTTSAAPSTASTIISTALSVMIAVNDTAFESHIDLNRIVRLRYAAAQTMLGSRLMPRRLVLFSTLKPCYDTNIRFAQLDAVRSWAALPLGTRRIAPFFYDHQEERRFLTSVPRANYSNVVAKWKEAITSGDDSTFVEGKQQYEEKTDRLRSPRFLPPPAVSVYLFVGGVESIEKQQMAEYEAAQQEQRVAAEAKERLRKEKEERLKSGGEGKYNGDEAAGGGWKSYKKNEKKKDKLRKALHNSFYPYGETSEAMAEGQCSQWISDAINADYGEGSRPPSFTHLDPNFADVYGIDSTYNTNDAAQREGGERGEGQNEVRPLEVYPPPPALGYSGRGGDRGSSGLGRSVGGSAKANNAAPPRRRVTRGPIRVIQRSETPRGKSGTVLLGDSIYKVVDLAVEEEIRVIEREALAMLRREVGRLYLQFRRRSGDKDARTRNTNDNTGDSAGSSSSSSSFVYSESLGASMVKAAKAFASNGLSFDKIADRIVFGFINGDILLDPISALAIQQAQDAFQKAVFIVGKRRSVKVKLKHRQSAVEFGIVPPPPQQPHHTSPPLVANDFGPAAVPHTLVISKDSLFDVSTAGWEMHPIFTASASDRSDAEDFFMWSGAFWSKKRLEAMSSSSSLATGLEVPPPTIRRHGDSARRVTAANNMAFIPNFHIGRPVFDNWFLNKAIQTWQPVVDASNVLLAYHQLHTYDHLSKDKDAYAKDKKKAAAGRPMSYWGREESEENRELALANGGWRYGTIDFVPIQFDAASSVQGDEAADELRKLIDIDEQQKPKGGGGGAKGTGNLPLCASLIHESLSKQMRLFTTSSAPHPDVLVFRNVVGEVSTSLRSDASSDSGYTLQPPSPLSWFSAYEHASLGNSLVRSAHSANASVATTPDVVALLVSGIDPKIFVFGEKPIDRRIPQEGREGGEESVISKALARVYSIGHGSAYDALSSFRATGEASLRFGSWWEVSSKAALNAAATSGDTGKKVNHEEGGVLRQPMAMCPLALKRDWVPFEDNPQAFGSGQELGRAWKHYYQFTSGGMRSKQSKGSTSDA